MAKILIISLTDTAYGVQHLLNQEFAIHLEELGHETKLCKVYTGVDMGELHNELCKSNDLVLSFNNILLNELVNSITNENVFELLSLPYCGYLLDHPAYHINRLNTSHRTLEVACVDASHVPYIEKAFNHRAFYVPHGACAIKNAYPPLGDRPMKIMFAGTYLDPVEQIECVRRGAANMQIIIADILVEADANPLKPLAEIVLARLRAEPLFEEEEIYRQASLIFQPVDLFLRANRRIKVLDVLTEAGIKVELCGANWEKSPFADKHPVHPPLPYDELMKKSLGDTQIVMNIHPNYVEGSHERILTGMLGGGVGLTDANLFTEKHFTNGEDILSFDWDKLDALPDMLHDVMNKPKKLEEIALAGHENVRKNHLWKNRMETILEHFSLA